MIELAAPAVQCVICQDGGVIPAAFALPTVGALITPRPCPEGCKAPPIYRLGDVVRVRDEEWLSLITQPTDGPPTCDPQTLPEMDGPCCVPVALVRPYGDPDGPLRWVQQSDLTHASPDD
jgi:hypothetical protein